jgi:hypothetical protein
MRPAMTPAITPGLLEYICFLFAMWHTAFEGAADHLSPRRAHGLGTPTTGGRP